LNREFAVIDGNEAAAYVAHKTNEVIAIYPITPSSPMGEWADEWSAGGIKNIWGTVPLVVEMQSEGGAAGAVHGALQTGSLSTTFTASQGLLLMIPNMFKIAGELTSTVFHIAARTLATHALSIFGDHGDVMSTRSAGWGMLFSGSIQEIMDIALIAQAATLESRVPFLHAFDGFRSSHEANKIIKLSNEEIRAMIDDKLVRQHRMRALSPDRPVIRGTAQNPDVFFQARERANPYYEATPAIVQKAMNKFYEITGRRYNLFDYFGHPEAERVIVMMGSGSEAADETVQYLQASGEKIGLIKVRLYRPFDIEAFLNALPASVKKIAILDRTKEPGAIGEPLYLDVIAAINEGTLNGRSRFIYPPRIVGGRYGLSSKEFTPAMVKGVYDELKKAKPKNHFTVGIIDDVSHTSIDFDPAFDIEPDNVVRAMFWGLGADGTVGANKNSIKIIGEETDFYAQGYFVYDSKKSGARTVSHLRFGPKPIQSTYLIGQANFIAVHQFNFIEKYDVLREAKQGAVFLLNTPYHIEEVWDRMPRRIQQQIIDKKIKFYVIDAYDVAKKTDMGVRINTIMQTCFFAISGVLPRDEAITQIKKAIEKTYGKRGPAVIEKNFAAVDETLRHLHLLKVPAQVTSTIEIPPVVSPQAPEFVQKVTAPIIAGEGDALPVSAMPVDGTFPTATTQWEKRNVSLEAPIWEPDLCIQCGKCALVCPHAVIRAKLFDESYLANAPTSFKAANSRFKEAKDQKFTLQFSVEDCTGCKLCMEVCPSKDKSQINRKAINMGNQLEIREQERVNWEFFLKIPDVPRHGGLSFNNVKNTQLLRPLFEFSGACAGCGETPYVGLMSRLFGDRMIIANATGCSSIYGGNLPTTPFTVNDDGRGPAWCNSLFEDNAEFGLGMRLTIDKQSEYARELVMRLRDNIGNDLAESLLAADMSDEAGIAAQRQRVAQLKGILANIDTAEAKNLHSLADMLVKKSVWILGGDGWAYDIGYGGLDHVLASGRNVNILVMDTEVYSNTGGQSSKATPLGAVAKFAAAGKGSPKKDLGLMATSYGYIYVAQIAMGANDAHTVKAFLEAESYDGPSLLIAYSHCIAHGIDMAKGLDQQQLAVKSGHWPLYRYDPRLKAEGKNPFQLDSKPPSIPVSEYIYTETRYRMLLQSMPERSAMLTEMAQKAIGERWALYELLAGKQSS
jgi:pyruvate-ferredoxin/flavodoxin oxidoreductase